jgi:hypothetical protein
MYRHATPLLVSTDQERKVESLLRIDLNQTGHYDERWVQELVHYCPSVLPIGAVEAAFWPATPVCMELPIERHSLDNLLVTPRGDLIAVECKLWRNAEAKREVVAQIIDYAKDMQRWSYTELQEAIRRANKDPGYNLFAHMSATSEPDQPLDEPRFIDAITRNLRRGRWLLVIVGDGINENVEAMAEFLQQHAGLHFALVLVQLAVHELPGASQRIVIPSIPMRTTNIVRGIVRIEDGLPTITPPPDTAKSERATSLTDDEMFSALDRLRPDTSDRLVAFLRSCEDLQVTWEIKRTLIVRMIVGEYKVLPFVVNPNGNVDTSYTFGQKELTREFMVALAAAIPGTFARETPKTWYVKKRDESFFTVWDLLENRVGCRAALEELNKVLHRTAE